MKSGLIDTPAVVLAIPNGTPEEVVAVIRKDLEARRFDYDVEKGFRPAFKGLLELRDDSIRSIWSVAFVTAARNVPFRGKIVEVPEEYYFGVVDDETGKLLYIIYSTGYLEPVETE